jgi:hypothetical protein
MFDHAEAVITIYSQKPLTVLGPHKIGESYAEWLRYVAIDPRSLCKTNKPACKALTNIEKTGNGVFYTSDSTSKTIGWTFADHKVAGITPQ